MNIAIGLVGLLLVAHVAGLQVAEPLILVAGCLLMLWAVGVRPRALRRRDDHRGGRR